MPASGSSSYAGTDGGLGYPREDAILGQHALRGIKLAMTGTAAQFIKALGKVSLMEILNLCKPEVCAWLGEAFLQQAIDFEGKRLLIILESS